MNIKVWHRDNPTFMDDRAAELAADEFPKGFTHVATVTGTLTEVANVIDAFDWRRSFDLTNHIDRPWWENPGVQKVIDGPARSTSVGDVVELEDGTASMVKAIGWEQIR